MKQLSLIEFTKEFETKAQCEDFLLNIRIKTDGGLFCPHCGNEGAYITNRGFKCISKKCHKKFTVLSNSIFENSKIQLSKHLLFIYYQALNKKNVSSAQMAKNLGLTQCTMWKMGNLLRSVLSQNEDLKLKGIVEIDEAFVSKHKNKWTRWGGICTRKAPIIGMIERGGGNMLIKEIPDRKRETVLELINKYVEKGSIVYTDGAPCYKSLGINFTHEYVEHSTREYVRGDVHTNNIENVWRQLKSNIRHAHHSVSEKYLQQYCDELVYRRNSKNLTPHERFCDMVYRALNYGTKKSFIAPPPLSQ